ncbi:CHASE2 domain-containing protein [Candidatus Parcubacteria bacterium]|nr:CHASE2 domain-containing protein [Candidatus Parcubacteria bacterium]
MISRTRLITLLVAFIVASVIVGTYLLGSLDVWQEKIQDRFFLKKNPPADIIIIGIDNQSLNAIGQWPWPREVFAKALRELGSARAIGIDIHFSESSRLGLADDTLLEKELIRLSGKVILPQEIRPDGFIIVRPLQLFADKASLGFINVSPDSDGVLRKNKTYLASSTSFDNASSKIPAKEDVVRIDYRGPIKTFPIFSFIDLINKKIPERILADSTVLIGVTADSLHDTIATPFGVMSGVEAHANIIATLEQDVQFKTIPRTFGTIFVYVAAFLATLGFWLNKRFMTLLLYQLGLALIIAVISLTLFSFHILVPFLYIFSAGVITAIILVALLYITESREKQFIRKSFQYYLTPEIIEEIINDPKKLRLGGERKKVTIFFSDIRGFTTLSEKMSPEKLTHIINEYLTGMTDTIMNSRGLVDKYIGDAVMAFWGAPVANQNQVADACRSVFGMIAELERLNIHWQEQGLPRLEIGMGINTGEVIVGNMGSERRFNYTIMGDEVNFASRLEGITKTYSVQCILGESAAHEAEKAGFTIRELDEVMVKGKKEPKKIFELVTCDVDETFKKVLTYFHEGRTLYRKGQFEKAILSFKKALEYGEDGPSKLFLERSEYLLGHTPESWTGVFEFKTK